MPHGALENSGAWFSRNGKTESRISEYFAFLPQTHHLLQSRGIRDAAMKQPPAAIIESTEIVIASGLGSLKFEIARDHWSMIKPNVPTYVWTCR
jgi:hypothetical protein